jgi:hypothetical protein
MFMLVLVENDFQTPPECIGDSAKGFDAWDVIAAIALLFRWCRARVLARSRKR